MSKSVAVSCRVTFSIEKTFLTLTYNLKIEKQMSFIFGQAHFRPILNKLECTADPNISKSKKGNIEACLKTQGNWQVK